MNDSPTKKNKKKNKKKTKQRQKGTNIINIIDIIIQRITIQYCMYSTMIWFIPGARFSQILATSRVIF